MSLLDDTLASEDNLRLTEVDLLPEILSSWLFLPPHSLSHFKSGPY